ncbi:MAG TPA: FliH/SctL family protein, partial [Polyangia bacterium]
EELGVEALAPPLPAPPVPLQPEEVDRLAGAVEEMRRASARFGEALAANALEIGCLIARKILETELKGDPELRLGLVRSAVRRLGEAQQVVVHLSPGDREAVAAALGRGADGGGDPGEATAVAGVPLARVELISDTNLSPGDAVVESDTAIVDGRLGTRLEELRRVLSNVVNSATGDRS